MSDPIELIRELVALPGPSGQEGPVREYLADRLQALGYEPEVDAKGNLLVRVFGNADRPHILVTAHMDEIALIITSIEDDGRVRVAPVGGVYTFKWGEGPVEILAHSGSVTGVLSFGSIHTNNRSSVIEHARSQPYPWDDAFIFTGQTRHHLHSIGVRPGVRVALASSRRVVTEFGDHVASYFIDDRADLAVWLMALEQLLETGTEQLGSVTFAATTSEEVGGHGAQFLLRTHPADICVALEIGPRTPDADFPIDSQPTIWVRDGYAAMEATDGEFLEERCAALGINPHWQYLSRGGSDASCAAAAGLTARPITFGLPVENSHGYEIMHRNAPRELLRLLIDFLENAQ